ncbi:Uu.00g054580.m01.CDS01 [Anthostomella pinea]|uniref:Uu.00g054580.m01.CDS01 n=1 Tax=Anthostomella pinea TaxID=933095 RepID=A0AAI8VWP8_9PEZI|nr:Uu.00g054580.m01.CDS01 [Anthostomella pinea]
MPLSKLTQDVPESASASSQAPAPGALFGSTTQNTNTSTTKPTSLFGNTTSATTASQPQQTSSLFGAATNTATTQPQPSTSLFGSSAATSQPQQASGGLFGASTAPSQPQQTGSLFGGASQSQPQQPAQGGSLFGGLAQNRSQPQNAGSLFGANNNTTSTTTSQAGAAPSTSLFGSLSSNAQPANNMNGSGMFGQFAQQKPSLFGSLNQQPQNQGNPLGQLQHHPALGIGLTMGQSTTQQTVPGVRIDVSNLKGTTRFNDLQEDLQKTVEQVDRYIEEQQQRKKGVDSFMSGHSNMLESIPDDVKFVSRKYDGARTALESAAQAIESARVLVNQDADSARLSFRAIDNLKLPQQYHTSSFWSPRQQAPGTANTEADGQDLVGFFSKTADEMDDQMKKYQKNLTDIEQHMHGVSDGLGEQLQRMMATRNGGGAGSDEKIQELVAVLRDFEQGILKVAGDVGGAREGMTRLQLGDFMGQDGGHNGVY